MPLINTQAVSENSDILIFRGNEILVQDTYTLSIPDLAVYNKCLEYQVATDWFYEPDYKYNALLLENSAPKPKGYHWVHLRNLFATNHPLAAAASRALGILNWRNRYRFCSKCGSPLHESTKETARICLNCEQIFYPTISPAMIVLVEKDNKILLARHKNRNTDVFTCLAGYLEQGETLEECVAREVHEEAGISITDIKYMGSQSWPFPDQLMVAFKAKWLSGELTPETNEITELQWFTRDELPSIPKPGSVAYKLIKGLF